MQTVNGFFDIAAQFTAGNKLYIFVAVAWLLYIYLESKKVRWIAVITTLILAAGFYNPVSYKILRHVTKEAATFYRVFWIIPSTLLFAYFLYLAIINIKNRYIQLGIVSFICIGIISMSVTKEELRWPDNKWQIPDITIEVADQAAVLMKDQGKKQAVMLADLNVMNTIRQYNARICLPFSYYGFADVDASFNEETIWGLTSMLMYDRDDISPQAVKNIIHENDIEYIAVHVNNAVSISYMQKLGWQVIATTSAYHIMQCQSEEY